MIFWISCSSIMWSHNLLSFFWICLHRLIQYIDVFTELPGLILSAILVDKVGRRISMVLMYSFGFIFLLPLMFQQHELLTTSLLFGARMCFIGNFKVAGIYCPEVNRALSSFHLQSLFNSFCVLKGNLILFCSLHPFPTFYVA